MRMREWEWKEGRRREVTDFPPMHPIKWTFFIKFVGSMADPKWNLIRTLDQDIALDWALVGGVDYEVAKEDDKIKQRVTMQARARLHVVWKREAP